MADPAAEVEALTLAVMRAWVAGDANAMKKLLARDFIMLAGSMPPQLLDRPSFLAAAGHGLACTRFTFREVIVRSHGKTAWLSAGAQLDLALGPNSWRGGFLLTDLWRKAAIGGWKLAERSLARMDTDETLAPAISRLQLWK